MAAHVRFRPPMRREDFFKGGDAAEDLRQPCPCAGAHAVRGHSSSMSAAERRSTIPRRHRRRPADGGRHSRCRGILRSADRVADDAFERRARGEPMPRERFPLLRRPRGRSAGHEGLVAMQNGSMRPCPPLRQRSARQQGAEDQMAGERARMAMSAVSPRIAGLRQRDPAQDVAQADEASCRLPAASRSGWMPPSGYSTGVRPRECASSTELMAQPRSAGGPAEPAGPGHRRMRDGGSGGGECQHRPPSTSRRAGAHQQAQAGAAAEAGTGGHSNISRFHARRPMRLSQAGAFRDVGHDLDGR